MKEMYFVIRNSDGDTTVSEYTKEELLREFEDYGIRKSDVLTELPENNDTNYWGEGILIIKGKMVSPVAEEVITKYNID